MDGTDAAVDDLVSRAQKGDRRSLGELLSSHAQLVQRVSARITRNPQLQEDIFQETVLRVVRNIGDFKGACKFSTWLYRITINVTFSVLAKEAFYKKTVPFTEAIEQANAVDGSIEERMDRKELFRHAVDEIATMPAMNREVFSLFYFAEAGIDEISKQTGKSENAVKAVLFKGRKAIVKHLRKKGLFDSL
jgi:RNA polymerase sigma-70 factor (ECF subfamily)